MTVLERTQRWARLFILIGVGLVLCLPLLSTQIVLFGDVLAKSIAFQLLVEAMTVPWLFLVLTDATYRPNLKHPLLLGSLALVGALLLVLPFSIDPARSFWSTPYRMMGAVNMLHYLAWFLIVGTTVRGWPAWRRMLQAAVGIGVIVALVGLFQWSTHAGIQDITGTLGNSGYLAIYLYLVIFFALALFVRDPSRAWRAGYAAAVLLLTAALLVSGRRAPFLGLLVGLGVVFAMRMLRTRRRQVLALVGTVVVLVVATTGVVWLNQPSQEAWAKDALPPLLSRLVYAGAGDRLTFAKMAVEGWQERPIAGWGAENFGVVFNQLFDPAGADRVLTETWYDRAHDQFLEMLVTTGLIGFAAYLCWWAGLLWTVRRAERQSEDAPERWFWWVGFGLLAGYALIMLVDFDMTMSYLLLWTWGAMCFALTGTSASHSPDIKDTAHSGARSSRKSHPFSEVPDVLTKAAAPMVSATWAFAGCGLLAVLLACAAYPINIQPFMKALLNMEGSNAVKTDRAKGFQLLSKSFAGDSWIDHDLRAWTLSTVGPLSEEFVLRTDDMKQVAILISDEYLKDEAARPFDDKIRIEAARAHTDAALFDPAYLVPAQASVNAALSITDKRSEAYEYQAEIDMIKGDWDGARASLETALGKVVQSPALIGHIDVRLAYVASAQQRFADVFRALDDAKTLGYSVNQDMRIATRLGEDLHDPAFAPQAVAYADAALQIFSGYPPLLQAGARLHHLNGDDLLAKTLLNELEKQDPALAGQTRTELGF